MLLKINNYNNVQNFARNKNTEKPDNKLKAPFNQSHDIKDTRVLSGCDFKNIYFSGINLEKERTRQLEPGGKFIKAFANIGLSEEEFVKTVKDSGKCLGHGEDAYVYEMPFKELKDYVLRIIKYSEHLPQKVKEVPDLLYEDNFGQRIAIMGKGFEILKKAEGVPGGIKDNKLEGKQRYEAHVSYLRTMSAFPIEMYVDFANKLKKLNDAGFVFDANPNNILIDERNKKINIIDVSKAEGFRWENNLWQMMYAFMDYQNCFDDGKDFITTKLCSNIFDKCIDAAKITGLPIPDKDSIYMINMCNFAGKQDKWPEYRKQLL